MNIVILGAGEVGRELAWSLCERRNNVTVVDHSAALLERLKERLDVMTVTGDCAVVATLKAARVAEAALLIAATGSDTANVLACRLAHHFGVGKIICRLSSADYFSEEDGLPPSALGITHLVLPEADCVQRIVHVLEHPCIVERLALGYPGVEITALRVAANSVLAGTSLRAFPRPELLDRVRFCALLRSQQLVTPRGDTVFAAGDEVYTAGQHADVEALYELFDPRPTSGRSVVLAGTSRLARKAAAALIEKGYSVRVIESRESLAESFLDDLGQQAMLIRGDPTDDDVLEEARVPSARAFVSLLEDDEDNILSSILAKKHGAAKVVTVTNKAEYVDIVPAMATIDCAFSPRLVAVNSVLRALSTNTVRVQALLHRTHACVYELHVHRRSPVCGKALAACGVSANAVVAMVIRDGNMVPATGGVVLSENDLVMAVTTPAGVPTLERLFARRGFLGL